MRRLLLACFLATLTGLSPLYPQSARIVGRGGIVGVARPTQSAPGIPDPLVITTATPLPSGTEQAAYSEDLTAIGGTTPYVWDLTPGSDPLPPGLTLSSGGTISGTPTAAGTYPFTVRVTDAQPVEDTQVMAITIDPAPPADPVLFTYSEETDMSGFGTAGGSSVTSTGLIDGNREVTKTAATVTVWDSGWNVPEVFIGLDVYRPADLAIADCTNTSPVRVRTTLAHGLTAGTVKITGVVGNTNCNVTAGTISVVDADEFDITGVNGNGAYTSGGTVFLAPATNRYQAIACYDTSNNVLLQAGPELDWDYFVKTPGQTTFSGRGFFAQPLTAGASKHIRLRLKKGTGVDAELDMSVDGAASQSFTAGTITTNIDRCSFVDDNDSASDFPYDRIYARSDAWEAYTPPSPAPPPPPTNCFNNSTCEGDFTFTSGSDRLGHCFVVSEGTNRDPSGVSCDVDGALTEIGTGNDANGVQTTLWVKLGITPGLQTCTATFPGSSVEATIGCDTKTGVSSATAEATASNSTASGTSLASAITTASTDPVILAGIGGSLNGTATPSSGGMVEIFDSPGGQTPTPGMFGAAAYRLSSGAPASRSMNFAVTGGPMALTWFAASFPIVVAVPGTLLTSYGAVCDGVTDDAPEIQAAYADRANWTNNNLIYPAASTCLMNGKISLGSISGFTVTGNGSKHFAANGLSTTSGGAFFLMNGTNNFTIDNLDLDGNRANRTPAENSNADNLRMLNVSSANFPNVESHNACNDGFSVRAGTSSNTATFSRDLTFTNVKANNPYRNGFSGIEGYRINVLGTCTPGPGDNMFLGTCTCEFSGANGASLGPWAGVDMEPNSASASHNGEDTVVDGCLFTNNHGNGYSDHNVNHGEHNRTVRNSIFRGNRGGFQIRSYGTIVEDNWITVEPTMVIRFGIFDVRGVTSDVTTLNPARPVLVSGNHIDGVPPTGYDSGAAYIIAFGNCTPSGTRCGGVLGPGLGDGTAQFKDNIITNSGHTTTSNWCGSSAVGGGGTTVSGNSFDGTPQASPGCP